MRQIEARAVQESVRVQPAEFAGIDHACTEFLRVLAQAATLATEIGEQTSWGLGETEARLRSGPALVARLRAKAAGPGNSAGAVLAEHARIVEGIRQSHRTAHDRLAQADSEWGGQLRAVATPAGSVR